jgi:hypothetical protein
VGTRELHDPGSGLKQIAIVGLDRLLIIPTVDPEPGKRGAQNVAAIDAARQLWPGATGR